MAIDPPLPPAAVALGARDAQGGAPAVVHRGAGRRFGRQRSSFSPLRSRHRLRPFDVSSLQVHDRPCAYVPVRPLS